MKFSVIIITYNRKNILRKTIQEYKKQSWNDVEIIVVDNASTDGTSEMVKSDFPEVTFLRLPDNLDIKAINIGIEMSCGDILWRTDDDSFPADRDTFKKSADIFSKFDDVDIIATENINFLPEPHLWNWYPYPIDRKNVPGRGYKSNAFAGTGAGIRRKVYEEIGGFWEIGYEELEFSTRAVIAGYNIRFFPNLITHHFPKTGSRDIGLRWVQLSKQLVRYNWKYFPFWRAFGRNVVSFFSRLLYAVIKLYSPLVILQGIFGMLEVSLAELRKERINVPESKYKDITLGISLLRGEFIFFKSLTLNKIKNWKNKGDKS